jgi:hypothetical protein
MKLQLEIINLGGEMIRLLNCPTKLLLTCTLNASTSCTNDEPIILVCKMCNFNDKNSNPRVTTSTILLKPNKHQ